MNYLSDRVAPNFTSGDFPLCVGYLRNGNIFNVVSDIDCFLEFGGTASRLIEINNEMVVSMYLLGYCMEQKSIDFIEGFDDIDKGLDEDFFEEEED